MFQVFSSNSWKNNPNSERKCLLVAAEDLFSAVSNKACRKGFITWQIICNAQEMWHDTPEIFLMPLTIARDQEKTKSWCHSRKLDSFSGFVLHLEMHFSFKLSSLPRGEKFSVSPHRRRIITVYTVPTSPIPYSTYSEYYTYIRYLPYIIQYKNCTRRFHFQIIYMGMKGMTAVEWKSSKYYFMANPNQDTNSSTRYAFYRLYLVLYSTIL